MNIKVTELTKNQKDAVVWLQTLAAKESDMRPALEGIRITENGMLAVDGYVLGFVNDKPEELEVDTTYTFTKPTKHERSFVSMTDVHHSQKFPGDLNEIIPEGEFDVEIVITPEFLAKILKGFSENACIRIHSSRKLISVSDPNKFALLMLRMGNVERNDVSPETALSSGKENE